MDDVAIRSEFSMWLSEISKKTINANFSKYEENLDEFCVHCSKTTSRSTAWYACDQCCRWIHESCSAEPAENEQFLCKHCTI
ncbi:unnamed protein product [Clavelina lepadiformis]|uniref:Zinc finger PHD-type domain-containing protein n=1 Tax=Clavelina lepadiformis TaxID=159417 RepID=A0ABP0FAT6_CLALP